MLSYGWVFQMGFLNFLLSTGLSLASLSLLLRSAGRLVSAIPPDAVNTLVHEAAVGVNGQTDSLRALTESGDRIESGST